MKILMGLETFFPQMGGAELHVLRLAQAMRKRGHSVTIITATPGPPLVHGLKVYRFPMLMSQGKKSTLALFFYLPMLFRLVHQHDVIHGHYTAMVSAVMGALAKLLRRPFVVTLHGYGTLDSSVQKDRWLALWRRLSITSARRAICTSGEMASVALRFLPPHQVIEIPNGVDTREFQPVSRARDSLIRIGTVRRLVPKNGVQYLVEAAPLIVRRSPLPIEFIIAGEGVLRPYLERRVAELGLTQRFRFLGALPNDRVSSVLQETDIVVFPSSAESTSLAALEAMAMAKPIVASAVGGYPEMVGGNERGLLVRLFDRAESDYNAPLTLPEDRLKLLAEAVLRLVSDEKLSLDLGRRARQYVSERHDWDVLACRIEPLYRSDDRGLGHNPVRREPPAIP